MQITYSVILLVVCIIFPIAAFSVYFFLIRTHIKKNKSLETQKSALEKKLNDLKDIYILQSEEREKFEIEKNKVQEKNKKIWQMSETVYKEKKKVDEQIELLRTEKEQLEVEKKKVDEKVKKLWTQSMAIHKEKEKINEIKEEIEIKHREVIDSVNYAKRIQEALLPSVKEIAKCFPDSFILFKPRDIVSGDFYWFSQKDGKIIIASVDCTGHGVPGAFMSMIGNTLLNHIVNEKGITDPAEILNLLNKEVSHSLRQTETGSESRDGMDVAICCFEPGERRTEKEEKLLTKLKYAGANRPLWLIRKTLLNPLSIPIAIGGRGEKEGVGVWGEVEEVKADKFPIGGLDYNDLKKFTTHTISLSESSTIYIFTDGYVDQFGQNNKKLKTKKFKEILLSIQDKSMNEQKKHLDTFIENWRENIEQTDDILIIGIKVS